MTDLPSNLPLYAVLASVLAVVPIALSGKHPNLREFWTFLAAGIKLFFVLSMLPLVLAGNLPSFTFFEPIPGLAIRFKVDALGMLFALVASSLWIVTTIYSIGYMRSLKEHAQTRYYCFFALSLSATLGVAFSGNLLTLYLFYEMLSLSTYPLVTHHQDPEARSGGRKYLGYLLGTSVGLVLPAMILSFALSGNMEFTGQGFLSADAPAGLLTLLLLMFVFGFGKAALMPVHGWLPGAMVAPTPVSSLLHAVAVVKVGVFCILRVFLDVFGIELLESLQWWGQNPATLVASVAAATMILASVIALRQDGLKRRLAYSTIAQLSYIILGVALLSHLAVTGAILHIVMHAFGKITLFFCAGAIFVATGVKNISQMAGLGKRMPFTMLAFFIGSLSVIGLPPTGGFISKWYLVLGTLKAEMPIMLAIYLVSSFLNAWYFLPIAYKAFFCAPEECRFGEKMVEAPRWCLIPPLITAAGSILLFLFPGLFFTLASLAAGR